MQGTTIFLAMKSLTDWQIGVPKVLGPHNVVLGCQLPSGGATKGLEEKRSTEKAAPGARPKAGQVSNCRGTPES